MSCLCSQSVFVNSRFLQWIAPRRKQKKSSSWTPKHDRKIYSPPPPKMVQPFKKGFPLETPAMKTPKKQKGQLLVSNLQNLGSTEDQSPGKTKQKPSKTLHKPLSKHIKGLDNSLENKPSDNPLFLPQKEAVLSLGLA